MGQAQLFSSRSRMKRNNTWVLRGFRAELRSNEQLGSVSMRVGLGLVSLQGGF